MFANDGFKIRGRDETGLHGIMKRALRCWGVPLKVPLRGSMLGCRYPIGTITSG